VNADGQSVTVAFALVAVSLGIYHHWPSRFAGWLGKAPDAPATADKKIVPSGNVNDAQAALIAYGILLAATHSEAAPLAVALAWAIALVLGMGTLDVLASEYPRLFAGRPTAQPTTQGPAGTQAAGGQTIQPGG
jgi:hypothetical protein